MSADGRVHARADLVIDASGAHSPLRALLGGRAARPFAFGAMWTVVADTGFAPATLAQRYGGARILLGHLPVGRTAAGGKPLAAVFWSLRRAEMASWADGFAAWRDGVAGLWPALDLSRVRRSGGLGSPDAGLLHREVRPAARSGAESACRGVPGGGRIGRSRRCGPR